MSAKNAVDKGVITLFDIKDYPDKNETCRSCVHRESWHGNSKVLFYCNVTESNRTSNGLLKIKCKTKACNLFVKGKKSEMIHLLG